MRCAFIHLGIPQGNPKGNRVFPHRQPLTSVPASGPCPFDAAATAPPAGGWPQYLICPASPHKEETMAKGQVRSNREVRKPKKDRSATPAPAAAPGTQVKMASSTTGSDKKK
jgi:hypothetical protein